MIFESRVNPWN